MAAAILALEWDMGHKIHALLLDDGNGTTWASSKTAYTYFRVDTAGTPGYVTAS